MRGYNITPIKIHKEAIVFGSTLQTNKATLSKKIYENRK